MRAMTKVAAAAAGLLVAALAGPGPAGADPAVSKEEVFTALGVDAVAADYVVLVDTSNSMNEDNRYGQVRNTLLPFLTGLSPNDRVAVYTFDTITALRYDGDGSTPAKVVAALPTGPTPGGLTDIGAALDAALDRLERPDASDVATIVLVTDGGHKAPAASPYAAPKQDGWTDLTDRAGKLPVRTVNAYALPIGTVDGEQLLGQVFPKATVLNAGSVQDLRGYLDQAKEATRLSKAAAALTADIGRGVEVRWEDSETLDMTGGDDRTVKMTLASTTAKLPLTVTGIGVSSGAGPLTATATPAQVTLAPGAVASVELTVRWKPHAGLLPRKQTLTERSRLTLTGRVTSSWAAALEPAVPLQTPPELTAATHDVVATADVGYAWVLPALIGTVALAVLLFLWWDYRRRHPYMTGALVVSAIDGPVLIRFELNRRRPLNLRDPAIPGTGSVRGRRGGAVELMYSPDGSAARRATTVLPAHEPLIVSGLSFLHQTGAAPIPSQATGTSSGSGSGSGSGTIYGTGVRQ